MKEERISPAETPRQGEWQVRPITRLCVELEALCGRADPILTRMDHVCEQLPTLLRRVATPW
jgi:hypothetical protein